MEVKYLGVNSMGDRTYRVIESDAVQARVTDGSTDDEWIYWCDVCRTLDCPHTDAVKQARAEFEDADSNMGDATP